jgi:succinate dehydrogenase/fumarate reductase flavoprotein subunit
MGLLNTTIVGIVVVLVGFILIRLYNPVMETNKVIVIGGGLAGMSAALEAHKQGAAVVLLEKEPKLGGNSAKASSGINAVGTIAQHASKSMDTTETFIGDTLNSGGGACLKELVDTIVSKSAEAVSFLTSLGVDLSVLSKCGGHTHARTHRASPPPAGQPARNIGFEITSKLIDHLSKYL